MTALRESRNWPGRKGSTGRSCSRSAGRRGWMTSAGRSRESRLAAAVMFGMRSNTRTAAAASAGGARPCWSMPATALKTWNVRSEQPATNAASRPLSPSHATMSTASRSTGVSDSSAATIIERSTTAPSTPGSGAIKRCNAASSSRRRCARMSPRCRLASRFRATTISHANGASGSSARRRHAIRNVSEATPSAVAESARTDRDGAGIAECAGGDDGMCDRWSAA